MQLEPERLGLKCESNRSGGEGRGSESGGSAQVCFGAERLHHLRHFIDGKDNLDNYLQQFDRHATVTNWPHANWATQLSALYNGKDLDVSSRLSQEGFLDYGRLKAALFQRHNYTEQGYHQHFREG